MPRKFNSFLIRWWRGDDSERLELEHIQSGRKQLTGSVDDAVAWLQEQQDAGPQPAPSDADDIAPDDEGGSGQF